MQRIDVELEHSYSVFVAKDLQAKIVSDLALYKSKKVMILSDSNVAPLYIDDLIASLESMGINTYHHVIRSGDESKSFVVLETLISSLKKARFNRSDIIVTLGGGVVGDIGGFAAGIYMRGIDYYQIPTSLLAMVDASVGGKTAINFSDSKNMIGLFKQPKAVYCNLNYLKTLPEREFNSGLGEVIKYAILFDRELFDKLEKKLTVDSSELEEIVSRSIYHKAKIVVNDQFDNGERKLLNFGHTIAHAIETLSEYKIPHGEAVAIGMAMISKALMITDELERSEYEKIINLMQINKLPFKTEYSPEELFNCCLSDKKMLDNRIDEILIEKIGKSFIRSISLEQLERYILLASV